jgi:hypothetical protein
MYAFVCFPLNSSHKCVGACTYVHTYTFRRAYASFALHVRHFLFSDLFLSGNGVTCKSMDCLIFMCTRIHVHHRSSHTDRCFQNMGLRHIHCIAWARVYKHVYVLFSHGCACFWVCTRICMYVNACAYLYVQGTRYAIAYLCCNAFIYAYMCVCIHAFIHTHIYMYII